MVSLGSLADQVVSSVEWNWEHKPPEQCEWQRLRCLLVKTLGHDNGSWTEMKDGNQDSPFWPSICQSQVFEVLQEIMACYVWVNCIRLTYSKYFYMLFLENSMFFSVSLFSVLPLPETPPPPPRSQLFPAKFNLPSRFNSGATIKHLPHYLSQSTYLPFSGVLKHIYCHSKR